MKKIKGIIDRFEENIAVVEIEGATRDFDKSLFPNTAQPGDFVEIEGTQVTILKDETEKRRKEIEDLMDELWED
ncbi:DUF3006 domain-containing protein [Planococcus sp. N028]|uniref:DUF3006 domain-containing protein n=1 Tax=Planococcus shixiaomingii TaxID=3058393 RepID=A0ABT8N2U7_9BACL|nr:DUF3006 domain-containing protein [Planococcus sp. N028]MDN7242217.1 DUF3006 domain-containing protein [Planococcus sp. N028]